MKKVKYPNNKSYTVDKNGSKLSENNYLEKYRMQKQTKVTPVPNNPFDEAPTQLFNRTRISKILINLLFIFYF